ncbi:hypothetical protein F443_20634 [Phytophthora nicotianae P1569]|uniref:Uncharacterized protein n=1 Tax=Phytophthora nicotianae P1569 TaxID=1317065 RepID=V9E0F6_PHYNI|nr:hypothetical protein F443_20634 [Phytophthora nicotianae P1569]
MSSSVKPELVALSMSLLRPANARCVGRCVREFDARRGSRESHQEASLDRVKEERGGASFGRGGQNPAFVMSGAVDPLSRRTGRGKPGRDGQCTTSSWASFAERPAQRRAFDCPACRKTRWHTNSWSRGTKNVNRVPRS